MAEPLLADHIPLDSDPSDTNFATALDTLPIPQFLDDDFQFDFSLPEGLMAGLEFEGDEDFDFSLEDLLLPSGNEGSQFGEGSVDPPSAPQTQPQSKHYDCLDRSGGLSPPDSGKSSVLGSPSSDSGSCRVLDSPSPDRSRLGSGCVDRDLSGSGASRFDGERRLDVDIVPNFPLPDSESKDGSGVSSTGVLDFQVPDSSSSDREGSGSGIVSSRVSNEWKCESARVLNAPSPDSSCSTDRHPSVSVSSLDSGSNRIDATDQKIKLEEGKEWSLKRKKDIEDGSPNPSSIPNPRSSKFRRSAISSEDAAVFCSGNEEEHKKKARLMRNRESAQLSRQRKKHYVEELEDKVRSMHSTIAELNSKISFIMAENASLRQQVGSGPPLPGVYLPTPMAPLHYPWVPCSSYALKPQGSSQVPLIPIPRLKPQQPVSASKAKSRTKKVASVSFLGLLFFVMIFGGLIPVANLRFGEVENSVSGRLDFGNTGFMGLPRGKVLTVGGGLNGLDESERVGLFTGKSIGKGDLERISCGRGGTKLSEAEVKRKQQDGFVIPGNASEPLIASLYVPRNDKLVKIDGNLIIHSVLASEKAMASSQVSSDKEVRNTGLVIPNNLASALAVSKPGADAERNSLMQRQKALAAGSKDRYRENVKSSAADGPLQQWFQEGLAGPILSSGMCTEVFQFEVSPASTNSGVIVPATSIANISPENSTNTSRNPTKTRNRRILIHPPIRLRGSNLNTTEEHFKKSPENGDFQRNKSASSMVVSVMVDPREVGDGDGDSRISPKSLSRIFVVVLMDSVKYVTYSCVLPLKGSGPHLVTT